MKRTMSFQRNFELKSFVKQVVEVVVIELSPEKRITMH